MPLGCYYWPHVIAQECLVLVIATDSDGSLSDLAFQSNERQFESGLRPQRREGRRGHVLRRAQR